MVRGPLVLSRAPSPTSVAPACVLLGLRILLPLLLQPKCGRDGVLSATGNGRRTAPLPAAASRLAGLPNATRPVVVVLGTSQMVPGEHDDVGQSYVLRRHWFPSA